MWEKGLTKLEHLIEYTEPHEKAIFDSNLITYSWATQKEGAIPSKNV